MRADASATGDDFEIAFPLGSGVDRQMLYVRTHLMLGLCLGLLSATGCGGPDKNNAGPPAGGFPVSAVVAQVETELTEDQVVLVSSLAAKNDVTILSELDAPVREILFVEGDPVKQGAPLFRLDPVQTEARLAEAEAAFKISELSFQRNQQLLANQTISQQEFDQSEATYYEKKAALALARDDQQKTEIAAPFDGIMGERDVSVGQYVTRGTRLARLVSVDPVEIVFRVPERYLPRLAGDTPDVSFTADAIPDRTFEGVVTFMSPTIEEKSRTLLVKADLPNPEGQLRPGMYGQVTLVLEQRAQGLIIPEAAIRFMAKGTMVVVVGDDGKAAFRPVEVGQRYRRRAEILSGLEAGERVVVEGYQKMGPGTTVIAAPESAQYGITPGPLGPRDAAPPLTEAAPNADESSHADL